MRSPSPTWPITALALALVGTAAWTVAIGHGALSCPAEGTFSCATLVRPSLRTLGPIPIVPTFALAALAQLVTAALLSRRIEPRFARDAALASAVGAGFAVGLQPLALLVAGRACPVCLVALLLQIGLAFAFAAIAARSEPERARSRSRAAAAAFAVALAATAPAATRQGFAQRRADVEARTALAALDRAGARMLLVTRGGCPYCEALALDVLARPEWRERLVKTGLAQRGANAGEPAPLLIARDARGEERLRYEGFSTDPEAYERVLVAAEAGGR